MIDYKKKYLYPLGRNYVSGWHLKDVNYNIIKSHNQLHDRSNLIGTISYYNLSQD